MTKDQLNELVERVMRYDYGAESEHDAAILQLQACVADPQVTSYIYYWDRHFEAEPTAAEVVQRALDYQPIALPGPGPTTPSDELA